MVRVLPSSRVYPAALDLGRLCAINDDLCDQLGKLTGSVHKVQRRQRRLKTAAIFAYFAVRHWCGWHQMEKRPTHRFQCAGLLKAES